MRSAWRYAFITVVLLYAALSFFNFPSADDFSYASMAISKGFWGAQHQWYVDWSGRYTSTAMLSVSPLVYGWYFGYTVTALVTFGLFCFSLSYFFSTVVGDLLDCKLKARVFSAFMIIYLAELPSPVEGIYWFSGAVNYTWPWILFLLSAAWYLRSRSWQFSPNNRGSARSGLAMSLILGLVTLVLAGFNETIILLEVYFIAAAVVFYYRSYRKWDLSLILPLVACFIGLAIVIKAPGNDVRASHFTQNKNLARAVVKSAGLSLEVFFRYLKPAVLIALALSIPAILQIKSRIPAAFYGKTNRRLFILGFIGTMLVFLVPAQWAMDGAPPKRAMNILCFLHLFFVGLITCQMIWAYEDRAKRFYHFLTGKIGLPIWRGVLVLSLLVGSNHWMMASDLLTKAWPYAHQHRERIVTLQASVGKDVVLKKIWPQPESLMFDDVQEDPGDWRNISFSTYYNLHSVRLDSSGIE